MTKIRYIILIAILLFCGILKGQIVDTTDIMKEFDEFSFRGAQPVNPIKDSTKIREHLIGVKYGASLNDVFYSQDIDTKALLSSKNFGVYYTYYHSLWNSIPLFGVETGFEVGEMGYKSVRYLDPEGTPNRRSEVGNERFQIMSIPFTSQFRIDFWKMRLLLNIGCWGSYKYSASFSGNVSETITSTYKKFGYGVMGGGGLAFVFSPIEFHFEVNYKYNFSNLYDKEVFYNNVWVSSHTTQLVISAGIFIRIGGSSYKNPLNKPIRNNTK